jgi:hypothetical protein
MVGRYYHPQVVQPTPEEETLAVRAAALHAMLHPSGGAPRTGQPAVDGAPGSAWKRQGRPGAGGRV